MTEPWANNILSFEPEVDPTQLLAHPLNARRHPGAQRDALRESLGRAGWVDVVKVNTRTGHVVDGHARVEEAITAGASVPVLYLDLSEEDERFVLATLDPISALASYDSEVLEQLLFGIEIESTELLNVLNVLSDSTPIPGDEPEVQHDTTPQLEDLVYRLVITCLNENDQTKMMKTLDDLKVMYTVQVV